MWKRLEHPNIVPFLGITSTPLQLVSMWMPGGDLTEHITKYPNADRLGLVSVNSVLPDSALIPAISCVMSLKAFAFSTLAT